MATKTYRVEWRGATITRKSAAGRDYTFVTVSTGHTVEREAEILRGEIKNAMQNAAYYLPIARGEKPGSRFLDPEQEKATYQGYYDAAIRRIARLQSQLENPVELQALADRVCEWGWSSRRDLAENNRAKAIKLGYQNVTVLEVPAPIVSQPRGKKAAVAAPEVTPEPAPEPTEVEKTQAFRAEHPTPSQVAQLEREAAAKARVEANFPNGFFPSAPAVVEAAPASDGHTAHVQRLGGDSLGNSMARGKCDCGWRGRVYRARQSAIAVSCAQSDVDVHHTLWAEPEPKAQPCCTDDHLCRCPRCRPDPELACSCTNYAGDNGPCAAHR